MIFLRYIIITSSTNISSFGASAKVLQWKFVFRFDTELKFSK